MKTADEMRAEIKELKLELEARRESIVSEDRDPTEEERAESLEMLDRIDALQGMIDEEKRYHETMQKLKEPEKRAERADPQQETRETQPREKRKSNEFRSFGEQLQAIIKAGMNRGVDPRLLYQTRAATGLSEGIPSSGGYLVQQDFANELYRVAFDTGMLASRCRSIPISGNANSIKMPGVDESSRVTGSRWGGVRTYWAAEADEKTASKPKFREIELNLHKLVGLCYLTDELLQDVGAMESYVRQAFAEEFAFMMDDGIVNGLGAGQPLGFMNAPGTVSVAKESGQTAATIVYQNILKMWTRMLPRSKSNAVWLINVNCIPQLAVMEVSSGGTAVYVPAGGASAAPYATIFGRPVLEIEHAQTLGTVGDIVLADFSGYLLATKGGLQSDMSIHVRFIYDESVIRFVARYDGQPLMHKPITPYKGSDTLSHFVTLATRA